MKTLILWGGLFCASAWAAVETATPLIDLKVQYGDRETVFRVDRKSDGSGVLTATRNDEPVGERPLSIKDVTYLLDSLEKVEAPSPGNRFCRRNGVRAVFRSQGKRQVRVTCLVDSHPARPRLIALANLLATRLAH